MRYFLWPSSSFLQTAHVYFNYKKFILHFKKIINMYTFFVFCKFFAGTKQICPMVNCFKCCDKYYRGIICQKIIKCFKIAIKTFYIRTYGIFFINLINAFINFIFTKLFHNCKIKLMFN